MTTHVFIVDSTTFDFHLKYLFAGTGAKDNTLAFLSDKDEKIHPTTEANLVGMIADGSRVRKGDKVLFYLQQNARDGISEGKFYGIFTAAHDGCFLDHNDSRQYLKRELGKSLTFRALITPHKVYARGVTEWEALDEIKNIQSPCQMLWSLIYRKLKGNRGSTMITSYEEERLLLLIRSKNQNRSIDCANRQMAFDKTRQEIFCPNEPQRTYEGRQITIDILPRLVEKLRGSNAFESHLQAYIVGNVGLGANQSLDCALLSGSTLEWLGNEVSCGVGMQRIDVMLSMVRDDQRVVAPIELKCKQAEEKNIKQIQRYVDWIRQYYVPNRPSGIEPVLVARKMEEKNSASYQRLVAGFNRFNHENGDEISALKYVEFSMQNSNLVFEVVDYGY